MTCRNDIMIISFSSPCRRFSRSPQVPPLRSSLRLSPSSRLCSNFVLLPAVVVVIFPRFASFAFAVAFVALLSFDLSLFYVPRRSVVTIIGGLVLL